MITPNEAIAQLERLSVLRFFPKETAPLKEYRLALEAAHSVQIAEAAVSAIIHYSDETPTVAQLRRAIWELNQQVKARTQDCQVCSGCGQETVWILVTYVGHGLMVRSKEIVPDMTFEKAKAVSAALPWVDGPGLGDNQELITGARPCQCRRAA
jgi:hypothetical protein